MTLPAPSTVHLPILADTVAAATDYARASTSPATLRAYQNDWRVFTAWCGSAGLPALPATPETVGLFLAAEAQAGRKVSTIGRRLVAIAWSHRLAGLELDTKAPAIRAVLRGIKRTNGTAPDAKAPLLGRDLRRVLAVMGDELAAVRDRALLLLGFAGAFRRSELVGVDWRVAGDGSATVTETAEGLVVRLRRSKTDQEGEGRLVGIPFVADPAMCPVRAVRAWVAAGGLQEGQALFFPVDRHGRSGEARSGRASDSSRLTDRAVALIVKRRAAVVGLAADTLSGHSLRAGLATTAAAAGASERSIMTQTGHRSERMVRRYIRDGQLFSDNAAGAALGQA